MWLSETPAPPKPGFHPALTPLKEPMVSLEDFINGWGCICTNEYSASRGQKGASDPRKLELEVVESCLTDTDPLKELKLGLSLALQPQTTHSREKWPGSLENTNPFQGKQSLPVT